MGGVFLGWGSLVAGICRCSFGLDCWLVILHFEAFRHCVFVNVRLEVLLAV